MSTEALTKKTNLADKFTGKWHNQHNSELDIKVDQQGRVTGIFKIEGTISNATSEEFPVCGFIANDVIGFCVAFEKHNCVTSWTGQIAKISEDQFKETVHTLWHMSVQVGKQAENSLWKSVLSGADVFERGPRSSERNTLRTTPSHPLWMNAT
jgi:hypothetical protein